MGWEFLNLPMLWGMAGVSLPVIAHLLSKRRYDVVQWGAMQFLELGRNKRRRVRLEELLLLLLRMLLMALLAFALSRPFAKGGWFARVASSGQKRDIVLVIDSSYSMGWRGDDLTPREKAVRWAGKLLRELNHGDTIAVIEARDQVRPIIEKPLSDHAFVREELDRLPPPAGSSNLAAAVARAVQVLSHTQNPGREVIVLTDGQARGWSADDANLWTGFDQLVEQASVRPRIWVVNVANENGTVAENRPNVAVDRLQISRELSVPGFPVRIATKLLYSGGEEPRTVKVSLEVNGKKVSDHDRTERLEPGGEATLEFIHEFDSVGSKLISVVIGADDLPGDDRADAAITVSQALPVLLVNGDPQLDEVKAETFFPSLALTPAGNDAPWVKANVVEWNRLQPADFDGHVAVVLANVPRISGEIADALKRYVADGGGLFIALGDRVRPETYNELLFGDGNDLLPAELTSLETPANNESPGERAMNSSLELPWVLRFKEENGDDFTDARFTRWWKVIPATEQLDLKDVNSTITASTPIVAARLTSQHPMLITRNYGRGGVLLSTVPLDGDESTFPAKRDYVPWLHEMLFYLASKPVRRNVDVGMPLMLPFPENARPADYLFHGPHELTFEPVLDSTGGQSLIRLNDTRLPGVYIFAAKGADPNKTNDRQHFVVNFDRGESDLRPLGEDRVATLTANNRMAFVSEVDELMEQMIDEESGAELWRYLLLVFVLILVGEVLMTRHLVKGGHATVDLPPAPEPEPELSPQVVLPVDEPPPPDVYERVKEQSRRRFQR
ncbi:MAG: VWA domain-containing protein [Planctomycetota bacterium]|nr:VWA domain-containing protein [Planctomycetota bacterium]